MIPWLLQQMEQQPGFVVTERELATRWPTEFGRWRGTPLLQRTALPASVVCDGRRLEVVRWNGHLVGLDTDDTEAEPVPLQSSDLVHWRVDLPTLAKTLRDQHHLTGSTGPLDARVHLLGERTVDQRRVAFLLALLPDDAVALLHLAAVPGRLDHRYEHLVALCPSFLPGPATQLTLSAFAIELAVLSDETVLQRGVATLVAPRTPVRRAPATRLSPDEAAASQQHGFLGNVPLHVTDGRAGRQGVWLLCGETRVRLAPARLRLLLRLIVGLRETPAGWVLKGKARAGTGLIADGVCTESSLEQDIFRLRETLGPAFAPLRGEQVVEVTAERIRLSIPPGLVTCASAALSEHPDSIVRRWARRLLEDDGAVATTREEPASHIHTRAGDEIARGVGGGRR